VHLAAGCCVGDTPDIYASRVASGQGVAHSRSCGGRDRRFADGAVVVFSTPRPPERGAMSFAVERRPGPDGTCVEVAGEVDIDTSPRMRRALDAALAVGGEVVVDLGAVTFMDSSGLSALIAAQRRAAAAGVDFRLQHVPRAVLRLLEVTGMEALFGLNLRPVADLPPGSPPV